MTQDYILKYLINNGRNIISVSHIDNSISITFDSGEKYLIDNTVSQLENVKNAINMNKEKYVTNIKRLNNNKNKNYISLLLTFTKSLLTTIITIYSVISSLGSIPIIIIALFLYAAYTSFLIDEYTLNIKKINISKKIYDSAASLNMDVKYLQMIEKINKMDIKNVINESFENNITISKNEKYKTSKPKILTKIKVND